MLTKAICLLASISAAFAVPYITQPIASTSYEGGKPATVKWQDDGKEPTSEKYGPCSINIYVGNAQQQTRLQVLNPNVDVSKSTEINFTPDPTVGPDSNEYFIRVESLGLKDSSAPQYPAMAFSSKFTLTGMTGNFTDDALKQIKGQSTAPLAAPTSASGSSSNSSAASTTASGLATSRRASATSSSAPSASATRSAADAIIFQVGWAGALLSAFFGVAML